MRNRIPESVNGWMDEGAAIYVAQSQFSITHIQAIN